jgi:hypothetical protein
MSLRTIQEAARRRDRGFVIVDVVLVIATSRRVAIHDPDPFRSLFSRAAQLDQDYVIAART